MKYSIIFDINWTKAKRLHRLKMHTSVAPFGNFIKLLVGHGAVGQTYTFKSLEG